MQRLLQQNLPWIGREQLHLRRRTRYFSIAYPSLTGENPTASGISVRAIAKDETVLFFLVIDGPIDEIGVARPRSRSPRAWLMGENKIVLLQPFGVAKCAGRADVCGVHSY